MGIIIHHAIVVTASDTKVLKKAHKTAKKMFKRISYVSEISLPVVNGYQSFFIPPDGSKEGWEDSNNGNDAREKFKEWLSKIAYEDGSGPLSWVEIAYGECKTQITDHFNETNL